MQVLIITEGSRGDCQPFFALGCELKARGHEVVVIANENHRSAFCDHGLGFHSIPGDTEAFTKRPVVMEMLAKRQIIRLLRYTGKHFSRIHAPDAFRAHARLLEGFHPDIVLFKSGRWVQGLAIAEKLRCPAIGVHVNPDLLNSEFPNPFIASKVRSRMFNRLTHELLWMLSKSLGRNGLHKSLQDFRKRDLHLPLADLDFERRRLQNRVPHIFAYSEHLVPAPSVGNRECAEIQSGALFLETHEKLPEDIITFLEDDPEKKGRPIFFTWGSIGIGEEAAIAELAARICMRTGRRGILQSSCTGISVSKINRNREDYDQLVTYARRNVLEIPEGRNVDHMNLFPRCAACVVHGGMGTTHTVVRSATPLVVTSIFSEQKFWGLRCVEAGVSPATLRLRKCIGKNIKVSMEILLRAIEEILKDDSPYPKNARILGDKLRKEVGVKGAGDFTEKIFAERQEVSARLWA